MTRKIDMATARPGDKVHFRGGNSAIIDKLTLEGTEADRGDIYTLHFQDGTVAAFAQDGTVYSEASAFEHGGISIGFFGSLDRNDDLISITTPRRTDHSLSLSRAFNIASRRPGDTHGRHPALEFQTANHLRGIAGRYQIPGNRTAPEYEDNMSNAVDAATRARRTGAEARGMWNALEKKEPPKVLRDSWNKLLRLNPVLKGVSFDKHDGEEMYNAHLGVTSGFNVDDINFFLEQRRVGERLPAKQAHAMPVHGERLERLEEVAAPRSGPYWVASPKTAEKIEARFKRKGLFKP